LVPGGAVQNAKFKNGFGLRVGAGVFVPIKRFGINVQAIYRIDKYNSVSGVVSGDLDSKLDGNGVTVTADLRYVFKVAR